MPDRQPEPPLDRLLRLIFLTLVGVAGVALLLFVGLLLVGFVVGGD